MNFVDNPQRIFAVDLKLRGKSGEQIRLLEIENLRRVAVGVQGVSAGDGSVKRLL